MDHEGTGVNESGKYRAFMLTVHNTTPEIDAEIAVYLDDPTCDYYVIGHEGIHEDSEHVSHMHIVAHFENPRSLKAQSGYFGLKHHHIDGVKSLPKAILYCKGYKNGVLKEPLCGENIWYSFGIEPIDGVKKTATAVCELLLSGVKPDELYKSHPSFMLYNRKKVEEFVKYAPRSLIEVVKKQPYLQLIPNYDRFKVADLYSSSCFGWQTYEGEEALFMDDAHNGESFKVLEHYVNGHPYKFKNGFERIIIDPQIIFLCYSEYNNTLYHEKFDKWLEKYAPPEVTNPDDEIINGPSPDGSFADDGERIFEDDRDLVYRMDLCDRNAESENYEDEPLFMKLQRNAAVRLKEVHIEIGPGGIWHEVPLLKKPLFDENNQSDGYHTENYIDLIVEPDNVRYPKCRNLKHPKGCMCQVPGIYDN